MGALVMQFSIFFKNTRQTQVPTFSTYLLNKYFLAQNINLRSFEILVANKHTTKRSIVKFLPQNARRVCRSAYALQW